MAASVFLVVMNDSNCILRCRPSENSKLLPLLLFSMNFLAPWKWPHPSKPFEIRLQRINHIESPLPEGFLVEYLVLPCYCMQWITVHSQQAGNKINRVRFSNKQLSSNVFAVTFLQPCWFTSSFYINGNANKNWNTLASNQNIDMFGVDFEFFSILTPPIRDNIFVDPIDKLHCLEWSFCRLTLFKLGIRLGLNVKIIISILLNITLIELCLKKKLQRKNKKKSTFFICTVFSPFS